MVDISPEHGPEQWTAELRAAGWVEVRLNVWRSPQGWLFRGPYGAWCEMLRQQGDDDELLRDR